MKRAPGKPKTKISDGTAKISVDCQAWGEDVALGAAYLLTDRCFVALGGDRKGVLEVSLRPKPSAPAGAKDLAQLYLRELESQRLRWAIARNNLPVREHVAKQAILLANGPAPEASPAEELTPEQRKEIDDLIAEVETEIKALKDKKTPADPKGISSTWEERHKASS